MSSPYGVTQNMLKSPGTCCHNMCGLWWLPVIWGFIEVFSCRHPLHVPKFQTHRRKASVPYKLHCLHRLFRHNEIYQGEWWGFFWNTSSQVPAISQLCKQDFQRVAVNSAVLTLLHKMFCRQTWTEIIFSVLYNRKLGTIWNMFINREMNVQI